MTADQCIQQTNSAFKKASKVDEVVNWLSDILKDGPIASTEVTEKATAAGFAQKTLQRASRVLNIKKEKGAKGKSYWQL